MGEEDKMHEFVPTIENALLQENGGLVRFSVRLSPDPVDGGWTAECLELAGCVSDGDTEQAAIDHLVDAITAVLSVRLHDKVASFACELVGSHLAEDAEPTVRRLELAL